MLAAVLCVVLAEVLGEEGERGYGERAEDRWEQDVSHNPWSEGEQRVLHPDPGLQHRGDRAGQYHGQRHHQKTP